jgi:hypothetical protein
MHRLAGKDCALVLLCHMRQASRQHSMQQFVRTEHGEPITQTSKLSRRCIAPAHLRASYVKLKLLPALPIVMEFVKFSSFPLKVLAEPQATGASAQMLS